MLKLRQNMRLKLCQGFAAWELPMQMPYLVSRMALTTSLAFNQWRAHGVVANASVAELQRGSFQSCSQQIHYFHVQS